MDGLSTPRRLRVSSISDAEALYSQLHKSAQHAAEMLRSSLDEPLRLLQKVRFEKTGMCPITSQPLNFIEQLNQTFTILVSLKAVERLLDWHPEAGGFELALGTCPGHDITSLNPNVVAAEVFAATSPKSNDKLKKDISRLGKSADALNKYVFFASPGYSDSRLVDFEDQGVKVFTVQL